MSSFGFDAPEDVTDTTRPDGDSLPVPPEDPAEIDETGAPGSVPADDDPEEMPAVPSPS
ncbi:MULTISPECIES: hypothetical protein [unclassified Rathayibacter]|uniref:hypothetical protein n=1 Tax=unclassified Rathayibacter TaxID=2609250 RepID=UPI000AFE515F|nr:MULTISPECIES: hypothetical protein [unclassified Rathayibacter]